jgi:hypothetical protein
LEDSIERVISVIKEEDADNDSEPVNGDFNGLEETGLLDLPVWLVAEPAASVD